ncbi:fungal specific transcription factor [Colletotrichum tofieldiae]|nr:fungal specific transcription factor [Colletotrichum tofieldiae]GKT73560.1 fungal specific transcription factor [Colletotrichum tofieldiae]
MMSNSATNESSSKAGAGSGRQRAAKACLACRHRKLLTKALLNRATKRRQRRHQEQLPLEEVDLITPQRTSSVFPGEPDLLNPTFNFKPDDEAGEHLNGDNCESESDKACGSLWDTYAPDLSWGSVNFSIDASPRETNNDSWSSRRAYPGSRPAPTVIYSHLRFLTIGSLHMISSEDVNYLELQGCLHLPARPMLDDFVEQYYLHVHPLVPLIDEGGFWDMYSQTEKESVSDVKMSLLLFQSMLFSSCTFVPFDTIEKLGFSTFRTARAAFYRRVKVN